jgi:hypothetical protein
MDDPGRPRSGEGELIMEEVMGIKHAIDEFEAMTGNRRSQIMVVMGPGLIEKIEESVKHVMLNVKREKGTPKTIFGAEIVIRDQIPGDIFGIFHKDCLDHLDEHLDELVDMLDEDPDQPEWIQCDLCQHPLSLELAVGDDIKCPWCGDVNDLEDILGDE